MERGGSAFEDPVPDGALLTWDRWQALKRRKQGMIPP